MKNLLVSICVCMVLFSCKKEPKTLVSPTGSSKEKKYSIRFNLKDFTPEVLGLKNTQMSEVPLTEKVAFLGYLVYNEEGKEVSRIRQTAGGATRGYTYDDQGIAGEFYMQNVPFGSFTDSLESGNYTIVIVASQAEFGINSRDRTDVSDANLDQATFAYWYVMMENQSRAKDTFFKKFQLKVEDKELTQQVVLERIVAKVEINILDAKPDVRYRFQFVNEYLGMRFANNTYVLRADDTELGAAGVTRENSKFSSFILNTDPSMPIDIVIEAYQPPNFGTSIATKTIKNVPFFKNKVTVLTGNLHSTTAAGFSVKVNDKFDQDTVNISF